MVKRKHGPNFLVQQSVPFFSGEVGYHHELGHSDRKTEDILYGYDRSYKSKVHESKYYHKCGMLVDKYTSLYVNIHKDM